MVTDVVHPDAGRRPQRDPHERRHPGATLELRDFLFDAVYENDVATAEFEKATGILGGLWEKVRERPDEFLDLRPSRPKAWTWPPGTSWPA